MKDQSDNLKPVGYVELVRRYKLRVLPHWVESFIIPSGRSKTIVAGTRRTELYTRRYDPGEGVFEQITFALKYEGLNIEILSLVFEKVAPEEIESCVIKTPSGKYARKIWFLYEFLTERKLNIEQCKATNYTDILDTSTYYAASGIRSARHKINNNLLGNRRFCPLIRRTPELEAFIKQDLGKKSLDVIKKYPQAVLQRAVSYLYTKETKSSFKIERATPSQKRAAKFIELLHLAESREFFDKQSLVELQQAIVDERFANHAFRREQNYVGQSVGLGREIVHFAAPKPADLDNLMKGMFSAYERMNKAEVQPVLVAAAIAFGFVFMHPFDDGNGRIYRFLIHNILATRKFTPEGLIFPVSSTLLRRMRDYDNLLETFSAPLMKLVDYKLDAEGRMTVTNETAVHYRYIDMTVIAEHLFEFILDTVETELTAELEFLLRYDSAKESLRDVVEMPDRLVDLFIRFTMQNRGILAKAKRARYFDQLTDREIIKMESRVQEIFAEVNI